MSDTELTTKLVTQKLSMVFSVSVAVPATNHQSGYHLLFSK